MTPLPDPESPRTAPALSTRRAVGLLMVFALLCWAWEAAWLYPLRLLVTLLHEFGHALGALATGGRVEAITIAADGSGLCATRGGWRSVILPAGYVGSMVFGCTILLLACRTRYDRMLAAGLGLIMLVATLAFVRSWVGLISGLGWGVLFLAAARWLRADLLDAGLSFIGLASCLYVLIDLRTLLLHGGVNDASLFSAEILALPALAWALLWSVAAVAALAVTLRSAIHDR